MAIELLGHLLHAKLQSCDLLDRPGLKYLTLSLRVPGMGFRVFLKMCSEFADEFTRAGLRLPIRFVQCQVPVCGHHVPTSFVSCMSRVSVSPSLRLFGRITGNMGVKHPQKGAVAPSIPRRRRMPIRRRGSHRWLPRRSPWLQST